MTARPHSIDVAVRGAEVLVDGRCWTDWTVGELVQLARDMELLVPLGDPADREHLDKALRALGHLRARLAGDQPDRDAELALGRDPFERLNHG